VKSIIYVFVNKGKVNLKALNINKNIRIKCIEVIGSTLKVMGFRIHVLFIYLLFIHVFLSSVFFGFSFVSLFFFLFFVSSSLSSHLSLVHKAKILHVKTRQTYYGCSNYLVKSRGANV
jgi:hypothetical protein